MVDLYNMKLERVDHQPVVLCRGVEETNLGASSSSDGESE